MACPTVVVRVIAATLLPMFLFAVAGADDKGAEKPKEKEQSHYEKGLAASEKKDYEAAVAHFTLAIRDDPKDWRPYAGRSKVYHMMKDKAKAHEDALKACQLNKEFKIKTSDPGYVSALVDLLGLLELIRLETKQMEEVVKLAKTKGSDLGAQELKIPPRFTRFEPPPDLDVTVFRKSSAKLLEEMSDFYDALEGRSGPRFILHSKAMEKLMIEMIHAADERGLEVERRRKNGK